MIMNVFPGMGYFRPMFLFIISSSKLEQGQIKQHTGGKDESIFIGVTDLCK